MVQTRTRIMNQRQAVALNEGLRCKKRLWRKHGREQLESIRLATWASRRRHDLLELLEPHWCSKYFHLMMRRARKIAKVAMARTLAVRLYWVWIWRKQGDYEQSHKFGSHAGDAGNRHGVQ